MEIKKYTVKPNMPEGLKPLEEIAHNLWLSWNFDAVSLFMRLDYDAWVRAHQNPVMTLGLTSQARLEELAGDDSFLTALNTCYEKFKRYKEGETWYKDGGKNIIAYFSMEYGLDVSLPIYSGGLGVLSGDHMKSSSDLGLPLVGVGLLYRQGYFTQYLNADGFQQESYPENDWYNMPVRKRLDDSGNEVKIEVTMAGRMVTARVWEVFVGRNSLILLDTNIEENEGDNRLITAALYGGDKERRMKQEILLGIGGIRALEALGFTPAVVHMNEGHSAFLALERIRELMKVTGLTFAEAVQAVWPTSVFTTHTPVPAGNERFPQHLMEKYFKSISSDLGISWHDFLGLGKENPDDPNEDFCMTVLALRLSAYSNGVSRLHGQVSRNMWKGIWPGIPENEVPINHITNGVHPRTWLSHDMTDLLDRYFGPRFYDEPTTLEVWDRMDRISNEELWRTHDRRRERLVAFSRERLRTQLIRRGATESQVAQADEVLSPYALTISFARRFATYKRATLLFRDPDRLMKLLSDPDRPIQLIFAGKAHPHDIPGKELIKEIIHFSNRPEVRSKIVFLENYDMNISGHLISGSDLWLNTPRRPLEASGTSGMKAAINGVLNVSVLDGWWDEAYNPDIGWSIGNGEAYENEELQDEIESKALYDLLEREIIPMFYERGRDGLPREWIKKMKESIRYVGKNFCSQRMLLEYSNNFYIPAMKNYSSLIGDDYARAKEISAYLDKLKKSWEGIAVTEISSPSAPVLNVGDKLKVTAGAELGSIDPEMVRVELYYGTLSTREVFESPVQAEMRAVGKEGNITRYEVEVECRQTGRQGFAVRVLPSHPELVHPFLPGMVKWA
ncbi:MAG: alpha-glucan family phosphorylase [Spirochaetota bacterium]